MEPEHSDEERPLFPLALVEQQAVHPGSEISQFQSFRAAQEATQQDLEDLLSSDEEATDTTPAIQQPDRKRSRDTSSVQTEIEKKRQKWATVSLSRSCKRDERRSEKVDSIYTDRKGDRHNLLYQGLYRLDVSAYHRCSQPSVVPTESRSMQVGDRYFAARHATKERSKRAQRLRFLRRSSSLLLSDGLLEKMFIPLNVADEIVEEEGVVLESTEECVLRRTREFNAELRKNPYDLTRWMRYSEFQDEAVALTRRRVTTSSTAEKKVSILASALKYHPKSEDLLCELLRLTSIFSSPEQSIEKYQAMLARVPHSIHIWRSYWTYTESNFADFSCEKMRVIFEASVRGIEDGLRMRTSVAIQSDKAEEELVEAFLCGVQFDFQSGFVEKAIAKIQALLEWNFCSPENKASLSTESLHQLFKQFWESAQIPKIGEEGAQGFAAYADEQILQPVHPGGAWKTSATVQEASTSKEPDSGGWSGWFDVDAKLDDEVIVEEESDAEEEMDIMPEETEINETEKELMDAIGMRLEEIENAASVSPEALHKFLQTETDRSNACFMPMKPDFTEELDVDRLVLFEELQPCLFSLQTDSAKKKLLVGSLLLFGLDVSSLLCSNDDFLLGVQAAAEEIPRFFQQSFASIFSTPLEDSRSGWYKCHEECGSFVVSLLKFFACQLFLSDIRIRKLWLETAIEVNNSVLQESKRAKRVGRNILQNHKDDLNLWIAYAAVLWGHGEEKESKRVWSAVFSAIQSMDKAHSKASVDSAVFEFLEASRPSAQQLHLLAYLATRNGDYLKSFASPECHPADFESSDAGLLIGDYFRRSLDEAIVRDLTWSDYEAIVCSVHYQALSRMQDNGVLEETAFYATASFLLGDVLQRLSDRGRRSSRQCEALYEKYCVWMMKGDRSPREVKSAIARSLQLYPVSPALLMLLVQAHASAHTRSSLLVETKTHVFKHPTPITLSLVLLLEEMTSMKHLNVPGLFERVLKLSSGKFATAPLIWRLYLKFIAHQGGDDFKRVFLRSIRACPWSKAIWTKGLESGQARLKGNEMMDFLETMKEKGVLVRTDIYEILLEEAADTN